MTIQSVGVLGEDTGTIRREDTGTIRSEDTGTIKREDTGTIRRKDTGTIKVLKKEIASQQRFAMTIL